MPAGKHTVDAQDPKRGRPRAFDPDGALDAMVDVFWENGYLGTSYRALVDATSINQPSLYAAFGDKGALFAKVLNRYFERYALPGLAPLDERGADARSIMADWLKAGALNLTDRSHPPGCLVVRTVDECPASGPGGMQARECLAATQAAVQRCLERGVRNAEIAKDTDIETLAGTLTAARSGMAVAARSGASRDQLLKIAAAAAKLVPTVSVAPAQEQGPADH